ncbi:hypothetical protein LCI18_008790 [Fusarium solani-melongenae]|uniref:Uncharacterized protein n=1 Tax=Fusarium solani subsp. cucurbitae TaxID=2747967 RepID=A0ACD3Z9R4_FUSSC|nr:hypothetical protein LCI18_008790 [Fusarium solani-melongenae]
MDSQTSLAHIFLGHPPDQLLLWNGEQVSFLDFSAYDEYVRKQQKLFKDLGSSAVVPHDDESLGKVADEIRQHKRRDQAISYISTLVGNSNSLTCQVTLSLVVCLMLMVKIGSLEKSFGFVYHPSQCPLLEWTENDLTSLARRLFPLSPQIDCSGVSVPTTFDAWGLENVAGIKIEFTDNLADHLYLANDNTQLYVFHHVTYLEHQRNLRLTCCGTPNMDDRQLSSFRFWRKRLKKIKDVYDELTPDSFSQWWYDRRNGVQWHNFWVAIVVLGLTAFFGLIQCILAAIQVHKAYHPS